MESHPLLHNFFPNIPEETSRIYGLSGSSMGLFLSLQKKPFAAIGHTEEEAARLYDDISFFRNTLCKTENRPSVFFLPDPNGPETSGERAQLIHKLKNGDSVIASAAAAASELWEPKALAGKVLRLLIGQETERETLERHLRELGYKKVSVVIEKGEYSMKGWLLDIFPTIADNPVRIEFFGDEIESIRLFDLDSQRSVSNAEEVLILPAVEPSIESSTSFELLSKSLALKIFEIESDLVPSIKGHPAQSADNTQDRTLLSAFEAAGEGLDAGLSGIRGLGIYLEERKSLEDIAAVIKTLSRDNLIRIISSSMRQAERVRDLLYDGDIIAPIINKAEFMDNPSPVAITTGKLSAGFFVPGTLILTEREMFGERPLYRSLKKSSTTRLLTSMEDITPGDFVVHKDHGIGRFINIQRQVNETSDLDLIVLEYRGGDRLYIPVYNINRIKKYNAEEDVLPALDKLGGRTWQSKKARVKKALEEMAEKLLRLYAEREVSAGFRFTPDTELHKEFDEFFPYEETPDQTKAIAEIMADMESEKPMDRLLCGDVGYGKTEVAMRAAFKSVYDGRQVAVLVPTTILCEQHYLTFKSRFSAFPIKIDYLSRFKSKKEQALTLKSVAKGETDIIIATNSLLRKDMSFHNLGLLIIDEEHKFGVGQKERIKEIKKGVDVLSMTATPIPRTLQIAMSGIRPMSVIETPPEERIAVRSIVSVYQEGLIKEAIERELDRCGQVLFIHNTVFDIDKMADSLKRLLPQAKFAVAHGQMSVENLENVMHGFINRDTNVLVSTNIVGAGLDIPNANTIVINKADRMGLADLYQLKGRVGRSNIKAYAYFLIPGEDLLGDSAKKRLQAIREMSFLGAGFRLAMKDMEIRGAGNFLGPQQSGHVEAVGFDMYLEMLEKTVSELKGIEVKEEAEPVINLKIHAVIPDSYIEDLTLRLSLYRRIAAATDADTLSDIEAEMTDRFGKLPEETVSLLDIMRVKLMAKKLLLTTILETAKGVNLLFSNNTPVSSDRLFALQKTFRNIRFHKDGAEITLNETEKSELTLTVQRILQALLR